MRLPVPRIFGIHGQKGGGVSGGRGPGRLLIRISRPCVARLSDHRV